MTDQPNNELETQQPGQDGLDEIDNEAIEQLEDSAEGDEESQDAAAAFAQEDSPAESGDEDSVDESQDQLENTDESDDDESADDEGDEEDQLEEDDDDSLDNSNETEAAAEEIASTVEAILFASGSPLTQAKVASIAEVPGGSVRKAIERLNDRYEQSNCSFRIEKIAGGYQLMSVPEYNDVLKRLLNVKKESRLSQPAMESLAIVAYRQPILRADIESIRGVACGEVLRSLMERQLVKIVGRAEVIGRPMLYGTTKKFLEIFGLGSLEDLPRAEELREPAEKPKKKKPAEEETAEAANEDEDQDKPDLEADEDAGVAGVAAAGQDFADEDEIVEEEVDQEIDDDEGFEDDDDFDDEFEDDDEEYDEDDEEYDDEDFDDEDDDEDLD